MVSLRRRRTGTRASRDAAPPTAAEATAAAPSTNSVSLRALYRYATARDRALLACGGLALCVSSANLPIQLVVFGAMVDAFNGTPANVKNRVLYHAMWYGLLGLQQMITLAVQSWLDYSPNKNLYSLDNN